MILPSSSSRAFPTATTPGARVTGAAGFASMIRHAMERFAADGWKRHATWFLTELGRSLGLTAAYLFKNYPDRNEALTAVRLYSWQDPLNPPAAPGMAVRVTSYDDPQLRPVRAALESREAIWTDSETLFVPVHAGDEWWGGLCVQARLEESHLLELTQELSHLAASVIGDTIRGASVRQALRWSERLHRIQRDIALAIARGSSTTESIAELLALVCELGDFDAGAVDIVAGGGITRIAHHGTPPGDSPDEWCPVCRSALLPVSGPRTPRYVDADELSHAGPCPIESCSFHAAAVVPLVVEEGFGGALELFTSRRSHVPESVRRSLEAVGAEIAMLLQQVRADEAMRSMHERHQLAVESGRVGIWEFRMDEARFVLAPPAQEHLGLDPGREEFAQSEVLDRIGQGDRAALEAWLADPPADERGLEREFLVVGPVVRWISIRARVRRSSRGRRVVGTMMDITESRRLLSELERARHDADELSRAKSTFMARMSHEFRTPLNAILGYVQMMRGGDAGRAPLDGMEQGARHLLSMVENILDQNRLEGGTLRINQETVTLADLIDEIDVVARTLARDRGLRFSFDVQGPLPARVRMDGPRLRQVLYNLISNAVKFTAEGGVSLQIRRRGDCLRFAVTDTGPGIPPSERGGIFLPFRRAADPREPGSGLGLSISQELVQLMGSRIWLASIMGRGSTFWFTIDALVIDEREITDETEPLSDADLAAVSRSIEPAIVAALAYRARIGDLDPIHRLAEERIAEVPDSRFWRHLRALATSFDLRGVRSLVSRLESHR